MGKVIQFPSRKEHVSFPGYQPGRNKRVQVKAAYVEEYDPAVYATACVCVALAAASSFIVFLKTWF